MLSLPFVVLHYRYTSRRFVCSSCALTQPRASRLILHSASLCLLTRHGRPLSAARLRWNRWLSVLFWQSVVRPGGCLHVGDMAEAVAKDSS
jgi:hypothetical protein